MCRCWVFQLLPFTFGPQEVYTPKINGLVVDIWPFSGRRNCFDFCEVDKMGFTFFEADGDIFLLILKKKHSKSKYLEIQSLRNDKECKLCISIRSFSILWDISVTVHFCSQNFFIRMYSDAYGMLGKVLIIIVMLKSNLAQFCAIYGYSWSTFFGNMPPIFPV